MTNGAIGFSDSGSPGCAHTDSNSRNLPAWYGGGQFTLESVGVQRQTGRAALKSWISTDAEPVADTALLDRNSAVWSVLADR